MYKTTTNYVSTSILGGSGDLLLATCSQDSFVRLWRIREETSGKVQEDAEELTVKANTFGLGCHGSARTFAVTLEAVLIGHEDWVYSVDWHPPIIKGWWGMGTDIDTHTHTHTRTHTHTLCSLCHYSRA